MKNGIYIDDYRDTDGERVYVVMVGHQAVSPSHTELSALRYIVGNLEKLMRLANEEITLEDFYDLLFAEHEAEGW